jgi:hypothetical protein
MRNMSEAWLTIAIFTTAIIYSILYLGHWPAIRDYVNILDKQNWDLFGIYSLAFWLAVIIILPGILLLLSRAGSALSKSQISAKEIFLSYTGSLLPMGLMLWIAFVIPMFFVNTTFIAQSISDPFGWGWDFLGTANIPWHQFLPQYIPWFQALFLLAGLHLSLRNALRSWKKYESELRHPLLVSLPIGIFMTGICIAMLVFFTN